MRAFWHIFLAGLGAAMIVAAAGAQDAIYFDDTFGDPGPAPADPLSSGGFNYQIDSTRGTVRGNTQLFFSFSRFGIPAADVATFIGPDSIDFVFARVTGDAMSEIDGLLRSEVGVVDALGVGDADIYVLNPYGVVFGPTASLEVNGSFYVSTADVLRFDNGQNFEARSGGAIPLAVAPAVAFGFLDDGGVPATIRFDGTTQDGFKVAAGKTLSAIAGRIEIDGRGPLVDTATLGSAGGVIQLAAVPAGTEVPVDLAQFSTDGLASRDAAIQLTDNAIVEVSGNGPDGGARVVIRGGRFEMVSQAGERSGRLTARGTGASPGDPAAIDLEVNGTLSVDYGTINGASQSPGNGGASGDVRIAGESISLVNGSDFTSEMPLGRHGVDGSDVWVRAGDLSIASGSSIISRNTDTRNTGDVGDIWVDAHSISVSAGSITSLTSSSGKGGDVNVHAGKIRLASDPDIPDSIARIEAITQGVGPGGNLYVFAESIDLIDGGQLSTSTKVGTGPAGDLTVDVTGRLFASGATRVGAELASSGIFSRGADADGGNLTIRADSIELEQGADLSTSALGTGKPGDMLLIARAISVTGAAGSPTSIAAKSKDGEGEGGDLTIDSDTLAVTMGGEVTTSTFGTRDAGDLLITAREILVEGTDEFGFNRSGITSRALQNSTGRAGSVTLQPHDGERLTLRIGDRGRASVESRGRGAAGDLLIGGAELIDVSGGGEISASVRDVDTDDPGGPAAVVGDIRIRDTDTLRIRSGGQITAATSGSGFGGSIDIQADQVDLSGGAKITASSDGTKAGAGDAGAIVIAAADTFSATNSEITTTAVADDAGGGRISIQARDLVYFVDSLVETTVSGKTAGADAGDIFIPFGGEEAVGVDPAVPGFVVVNRSIIRANAEVSGAGDITIDGSDVLISADSLIQAYSKEGVSGEIQISSPDTDIASQVTQLASSFVDPSDRLLPPCVARTERTGSFMVQSREALPRSLDAPLPSTLGGAPGADGIPPASGATDCSVFQESS